MLAASALTGCFDPAPDISGIDGENGSTTQSADPTAGMTTGGPTTAGPSGTTTGDSASGTTSGETGDESSGGEVTGDTTGTDESSTTNGETSTGEDDTSTGEQDSESPSVESMMPGDGATGVLADATVLLVFSEPMDTVSVEAALDPGALGAVTLSWNNDDTELSVDPDGEVPYASGSSPLSVEALDFTVTLSQDATDTAGNALDAPWTATFSSARRLTVALSHDPGYTGGVVSNGVLQTGSGDDAIVGDHSDNLGRRGFFGFSIAPLPGGVLEFEEAELRASQILVLGNPMPSLGDSVSIAHIAPEQLPGGTYNSAPIADLGAFSTDQSASPPGNAKSVDVTANVEFDYDNAESHTQYRLSMSSATNFNSTADRLRYNNEVLEVTYLLP